MKKLKTFLPALMVAFSLIASLTASIAWFSSTVTFKEENKLMGETEGAYFAYGNGSEKKPFGINHPRHLYNLAWLQYLGIFNNRTLGPSEGPCYFELDPTMEGSLNMAGYTHLPPIGTVTNPFVGVFNGNGKTITNLHITNKYSDMEKHPTAVSDNNFEVIHIVGMFGVVGTYGGGVTTNYTGITEAIHDLNLQEVTVTTKVTDSLVGILAGYVNGPIADCGIINSSIDVSGQSTTKYSTYSNISDYSVVGFCEDAYKESVNHSVTTMYTPLTPASSEVIVQEEGPNAGWGGSIDMKTMYNGLHDIWTTLTTSNDEYKYKYYTRRTDIYNKKDELTDSVNDTTSEMANNLTYTENGVFPASDDSNHVYFQYEQEEGNLQTAQYSYVIEPSNITNGNEENFMCLTGAKTVTTSDRLSITKNYYKDYEAFYIKSSSGNHYLSHSGTTLQDKINAEEATSWALDGNNYLFTQTDDETKYYLCNDSGTLTVVTNVANATAWETDEDSYFFSVVDYTAYFITYDNDNWTLRTATSEANLTGYVITDGSGNYLSINNSGNIINATSEAAATKWNRDRNYIYTTVGGSTYYLRRNSSNLTTDQYYATSFTFYNNTIYYEGSYYDYYIYYNNGWTTLSKTARTTYWNEHYEYSTTTKYYVSTPVGVSFKAQTTEINTEQATFDTKSTYFPLRQKQTDNIPNGIPADTNTGYVVSGSKYYGDPYGDIRVSRYSKSGNLSRGVDTVYTINGSGRQTLTSGGTDQSIASNYENYSKARATMASVLSGDSYIYGLHFMNATISHGDNNNSAYAEKAVINGNTYTNYELPTDCIDFNLKEKGHITFFAGTYYNDSTTGNVNNSFFSLHEIVRDSNQKIIEIREIEEVYVSTKESYSNVYKYKNGSYSVAYTFDANGNKIRVDNGGAYTEHDTTSTVPTSIENAGYSSKFKTAWIGKNSLAKNYAYYFEIPMNAGEYCLGSVKDANGAYLMYLDIGANAEKVKRSAIIDIIKLSEEMQTYPKGVGVIVAGGTSSDVNSYCICIGDSYKGVINLNRSSATAGVATKSVASDKITLSYSASTITVTDGKNPYSLSSNATETLIERATYIEYHPSNNTTTKMVVTRTTINNDTENATTTAQGYILKNGKWEVKDDLVLYYDAMWGNGKQSGKKVTNLSTYFDGLYLNDYASYRTTALAGIVIQLDTNLYGATKGNSVSVTLTPTTNENANTHVHGLTGYDITISYVDSNGKVVAISGESVVKELNPSVKILNNNGESKTVTLTFTLNGTGVSKGKTITINITVPNS